MSKTIKTKLFKCSNCGSYNYDSVWDDRTHLRGEVMRCNDCKQELPVAYEKVEFAYPTVVLFDKVLVNHQEEIEIFHDTPEYNYEFGFDIVIKYREKSHNMGSVTIAHNRTEFHYIYDGHRNYNGPSAAFESDIHGEGFTNDLAKIEEIRVIESPKLVLKEDTEKYYASMKDFKLNIEEN